MPPRCLLSFVSLMTSGQGSVSVWMLEEIAALSWFTLASFGSDPGASTPPGTVKHTPYREILGSILELTLDPSSHEQEVARLKHVPLAIVNEHSSAASGEVISSCACAICGRGRTGEGEGHIQRATPKGDNRVLSRRYLRLGRRSKHD